MLYWKCQPHGIFITKDGQSAPGFKASKGCLTLLLCSKIAGDFKLKPLVIYHSSYPHALKGSHMSHLPVIWKSNKGASMMSVLFDNWFLNHFIPAVRAYYYKENLDERALPLVAYPSSHHSHFLDYHPTIKMHFFSPSTISII